MRAGSLVYRGRWPQNRGMAVITDISERLGCLLTDRETEVLAAMAAGQSNGAIAAALFISRKSVEKHVNSIFAKLLPPDRESHHPRVQAVLTYLDHLDKNPFTDPVARSLWRRPSPDPSGVRPRCFPRPNRVPSRPCALR